MAEEEPKSDKLNARVSVSVKTKLVAICKKMDRSQGWVVSKLIDKEYERVCKRKKHERANK